MSDSPKRRGPKPQFYPYAARLTKEQIQLLHDQGPRKGNGFIRDAIDFAVAHQALFLSWIATRS